MNNNDNNNNNIMRNYHQPPPPQQQQPQQQMYSQQLPQTASFDQGNQELKNFWNEQMEAVQDFKSHKVPLARIKKIMKSDRDVRMIAAEAPIIFAKACEMFIVDLTMRSWVHAEENKRRTLQKTDISSAVARASAFDFLLDVVPRDESVAVGDPVYVPVPHVDGGVPYYYPPVIDGSGGMYPPQQQVMHSWPSPWPAMSGGDGDNDEAGVSGANGGGN